MEGGLVRFRVDLGYPVGMDGMTVVGVVHRRGGGDERVEVELDAPGRFSPSVPLVDLSLWPGVYSLWLVAGQPPFGQWPRPWVPPAEAERSCVMEFNLRSGDDVLIHISDIPVTEERRLSGCPVGLVARPGYVGTSIQPSDADEAVASLADVTSSATILTSSLSTAQRLAHTLPHGVALTATWKPTNAVTGRLGARGRQAGADEPCLRKAYGPGSR
jgi:hypothetical protein